MLETDPESRVPVPMGTRIQQETQRLSSGSYVLVSKFALVAYDMIMNLVYIILFASLSPPKQDKVSIMSVISLAMDAMTIWLLILNQRTEKARLFANRSTIFKYLFNLSQIIFIIVFLGVLVAKVILIASDLNDPYEMGRKSTISEDSKTVLGVFFIGSILTGCLVLIVFTNLAFIRAKLQRSRVILLVASILQFLLTIAIIQIGITALARAQNNNERFITFFKREISLYFQTSAFVVCSAVLGVFISLIDINESTRFLKLTKNFVIFYKVYNIISLILVFTCFVLSLTNVKRTYFAETNKAASPIIFGLIMATSIVSFISSWLFLKPQKKVNNLRVEPIDLSLLTTKQKKAYAKLIDYNHKANAGISGDAAISLMESYSQARLDGMKCKVMRVYNDQQEQSSKIPSYENFKAWEGLDKKNLIFDDEYNTLNSVETLVEDAKPLSKNQLKKLAKKLKDKAVHDDNAFPVSEIKNEQDFETAKVFYKKLISTEALVLLTVIEDYDLTAAVKGRFGNFISSLFGLESYTKLLCVKFGLLGFHWPFRRASFYTSTTKRPVARSAGIMEAIANWNSQLSYSDRCSMIIDPIYQNELSAQAIEPSGWSKVKLPPSHVADLRSFKNKSLKEYLKHIRYRNKDSKFQEEGGKVIEVSDFSPEECSVLIRLWKNIAKKRLEGGNTSVLIDPTEQFIMDMNRVNENHDRTLLFLELDGHVLASSVLFRLGDTITTDIQGIDYEHGKDYKAYFVMMQRVIEIALKEGRKFVDFGPTTEKPKLDIGCQSVPLEGAITAPNWFLSICVKFAAKNVDV